MTFIVFAPAQASTATVSFLGIGNFCRAGREVLAARTPPAELQQAEHIKVAQKLTRCARIWHVEIDALERNGPSVY